MAADAGADMGLFFPRNDEEMKAGPKRSRIPLVYVTSRGNRDGRPLPTASQLADMGYKACIDAITTLLVNFQLLQEVPAGDLPHRNLYRHEPTGQCRRTAADRRTWSASSRFYEIEEATVEEKKWGKR